jgi:hypothetical protein
VLLLVVPLLAQEPAAKPEQKPAAEQPAAESPAPAGEKLWSGYAEVGARWLSNVGGDFQTYRSVVNLGEGIRITSLELNYRAVDKKLLDELHLQGGNWGGDPYNNARLVAGRQGLWRYYGNYANIAYFNYLPSFSNPGLERNIFFNQRAYDTRVRNFESEVQLFPGRTIVPYFGYSRNGSEGTGITTLVAEQNEYPIRNLIDWRRNDLRGGVRFEFRRFHATLEQGATSFEDDQRVYSTARLNGNRTNPFLGTPLFLASGLQTYRVRGEGMYSKALFTANPAEWLDFYGQFLYSLPKTNTDDAGPLLTQETSGSLVSAALGYAFYSRGVDTFYGDARMPQVTGSIGAEVRPFHRLRVRQLFDTNRYHIAANGWETTQFTGLTGTSQRAGFLPNRLEVNQNREQVEAVYEFHRRVTLRSGYRYEWGDAEVRSGTQNVLGPVEKTEIKRSVGLLGLQLRPVEKLPINIDYEHGDGKRTYFRTGLLDYHRFRAQFRYQLPGSVYLGGAFNLLDNQNPQPGVGLDFRSQSGSLNAQWMPKSAKYVSLLGDYTRSSIKSDLSYLFPANALVARSLYRDNAHAFSALADLRFPGAYGPRLAIGGSLVRTAGSRPSQFYQPTGRLSVPLGARCQAFSEWRWFGLTQPFYLYEGFRNHHILTGLRFML